MDLGSFLRSDRRRSPYGERGLKFPRRQHHPRCARSLSLRRAWIEMPSPLPCIRRRMRRSPYGERGLKYAGDIVAGAVTRSLSLRRAWIEILYRPSNGRWRAVALLTESVD